MKSIRPQRWGDDVAPEIESDLDEDSKEVLDNLMPVEDMMPDD